jgi:hypothetical protein
MSEQSFGPLSPVSFEMPGADILKAKWEVTLQEDGTLAIYTNGRRPGRIHIEPSSHTSIIVTTDRLTRERKETNE